MLISLMICLLHYDFVWNLPCKLLAAEGDGICCRLAHACFSGAAERNERVIF